MVYKLIILIASLLLCLKDGITTVAYIIGAGLAGYLLGLLAEKKPSLGKLGGILLLLPLCYLRAAQLIPSLSLFSVTGISFFTLQEIAYLFDIASGKRDAQRNLISYMLFVCYYPHLLVGPIEKEETFFSNIENRSFSAEKAVAGCVRIAWGAFKKLVIASGLGVVTSAIAADTETFRGLFVVLALVVYSFQLYSDFSGGVDIAIGISNVLGFTMSENFNTPYLSETVAEFWRRWHMTLGNFLKQYVYIPLGGNRKGNFRKFINTLATFLVSGIWHGSEYLLWGGINGVFVSVGDKLKTKKRWINITVTFISVTLLWCFFIWSSTSEALSMLLSVITESSVTGFLSGVSGLGVSAANAVIILLALGALIIVDISGAAESFRNREGNVVGRVALTCMLILLTLLFGTYGIGFNSQAFIYSRF